jgi:hypothetical protein
MNKSKVVLMVLFIGLQAGSVFADKVYVTRDGTSRGIDRANLDGSGLQPLISTDPEGVRDIAIDLTQGKMYFTQSVTPGSNNRVRRANLDGSNPEDLILAGSETPTYIVLNGDKMYWTQNSTLRRANLDGSNAEIIATGNFSGIAVAACLNKIYWLVGGGFTEIHRANFDGTNIEDILTVPGESAFGGFTISGTGKMYWSTSFPTQLRSANLDGTGVNIIATRPATTAIWDVTVDETAGKLYWSLWGNPDELQKLQRANLDGSGIEDVLTAPLNSAFMGVTLDFEAAVNCPAISTWGVLCLGLLGVATGTVLFRRRSFAVAS